MAKLDARLEAHLDGLTVGGYAAGVSTQDILACDGAAEVFVASLLALRSGSAKNIDCVLETVSKVSSYDYGLTSALGWLPFDCAKPHINTLVLSNSPARQRIGIAASAIHRQHPGPVLLSALSDPDPPLRARALRTVGELGLTNHRYDLEPALADNDPACRFWAAWSLTLLGEHQNAIQVLIDIAQSESPFSHRALQLVLRRLELATAREWRAQLAVSPRTLRKAISSAGLLGDSSAIPWLIEHMNELSLARVAGESFTFITGVDIAYEDLDRKASPDYDAGPTEDPADDNVELDPDENLPWPDPSLIIGWWTKHQTEFQPDLRYLLGKPISTECCEHVLRYGRQRQRAAAALELAILSPGTPLFNVAAPGFCQKRLLGLPKRP